MVTDISNSNFISCSNIIVFFKTSMYIFTHYWTLLSIFLLFFTKINIIVYFRYYPKLYQIMFTKLLPYLYRVDSLKNSLFCMTSESQQKTLKKGNIQWKKIIQWKMDTVLFFSWDDWWVLNLSCFHNCLQRA